MRHVFLKNAMEYVGYLCNYMHRKCCEYLSSCFISDIDKHMAQTYKTLRSQTSSVALQKEYATTSVKMNKENIYIKKKSVLPVLQRQLYKTDIFC